VILLTLNKEGRRKAPQKGQPADDEGNSLRLHFWGSFPA
jgi:hypothetical protein